MNVFNKGGNGSREDKERRKERRRGGMRIGEEEGDG